MRRPLRLALALSCVIAGLTSSAGAYAIEIENVAGEAMSIDVTNTSIFNYHFDNRNDKDGNVSAAIDDNYAEWGDRLNVQVGWWRLRLGFRLDAAVYAGVVTRDDAQSFAEQELGPEASDTEVASFRNQIYRQLNTRFINTIYPSKLWIGYTQPGIDATVGDFYAQLGRGLVFSVRKIDELSVDTTVRGGKIVVDHDFGPFQLGATLLAGQLNPLRIEETSGRRLHGDGSPLFFGFPTASHLLTYEYNEVGATIRVPEAARPSYLEDTVIGGRIEGGPSFVQLAANASMLLRKSYTIESLQCEARGEKHCRAKFPDFGPSGSPALIHDTIRTFSGSVNVPSIAKHGDAYLEIAGQQLRNGHPIALGDSGQEERVPDLSGYAIYASVNGRFGPLTVSLEGKHYRRFFPLVANVDKNTQGFSAPEFEVVSYSQPPTVEPIYVEPLGSPNVCVTGGRARADVRFTRSASLYAWLGRYVSYSELSAENIECDTKDELQTNTWDAAVGSELDFEGGKSHSRAWIGARVTNLEVPIDSYVNVLGFTDEFYREGYIRYDLVKHIAGPFTVQAQGFHRRRYEPQAYGVSWIEGENYTALQWSPHFSAILGYEYVAREGCDPTSDASVCHYVNGGLQWKSASHEKVLQQIFDTVQVFVGQRRGAVRCVSGVCRQFPPFEGAKLELVSRF